MKTLRLVFLALSFLQTPFAQGTLEFRVTMSPLPPLAEYEIGYGVFYLDGDMLNGLVTFPAIDKQTFIRLEKTGGGPLFAPSAVYNLAPVPAVRAIWSDLRLSSDQVQQLLRSEWQVNVGMTDYPNGVMQGPLLLVPEPSSWAVFVAGLAVLGLFAGSRASMKRAVIPHRADRPFAHPGSQGCVV